MRLACLLILALVTLAACASRAPRPHPPVLDATGHIVEAPVFDDSKPHDWSGRTPWHYVIHGIDVARYQGDIDWRAVRASGVQFAYIKATEGGDHIDPMYLTHRSGARRAGIRNGAYHYFYFCRPAAEQARWFIRNVPRDANMLPPVLDMEWNHRSPTCRRRPDGAEVRREARTFLNMIERHYGKRPVIYTTPDFYKDTGIGRLGGTEFWLRSVAGHPGQVYPGAQWTFWQYTGTGIVPGVRGNTDLNVFRGSQEAWQNWGL
jgi:lysozyme